MSTDNNNQNDTQYTGIMSNYKDNINPDTEPKLPLDDGFDNQIEASGDSVSTPTQSEPLTQEQAPVSTEFQDIVQETTVTPEETTVTPEEPVLNSEENIESAPVQESQPVEQELEPVIEQSGVAIEDQPIESQEASIAQEPIVSSEPQIDNQTSSTNEDQSFNQIPQPQVTTSTPETFPVLETPVQSENNLYQSPTTPDPLIQNNLEQILKTGRTPDSLANENLAPVISSSEMKPKHSIFRIIFLISLLIFLVVGITVILYIVKSNKVSQPKQINTKVEDVQDTAVVDTNVCSLNDKTYAIGQSFTAADGCNTCSCNSDIKITCTEKACVTPTVTNISTVSATPT